MYLHNKLSRLLMVALLFLSLLLCGGLCHLGLLAFGCVWVRTHARQGAYGWVRPRLAHGWLLFVARALSCIGYCDGGHIKWMG